MLIDELKHRAKPTPHTDNNPIAYGVKPAARKSGLSDSTIWKFIAEGKLRSIKVGGRRLILHEDLVALLRGEGA